MPRSQSTNSTNLAERSAAATKLLRWPQAPASAATTPAAAQTGQISQPASLLRRLKLYYLVIVLPPCHRVAASRRQFRHHVHSHRIVTSTNQNSNMEFRRIFFSPPRRTHPHHLHTAIDPIWSQTCRASLCRASLRRGGLQVSWCIHRVGSLILLRYMLIVWLLLLERPLCM